MFDDSPPASLADRVDRAISMNPYLARRPLRSEIRRGRVVLEGVVNSYFQKQMAQEAVRRVDGVEEIDNRLEVMWT